MKTIFWIILLLVVLAYSAQPEISFKPFSLTFKTPYTPFAIFFLIVSLSLFQIQSEEKGFNKGVEKTIDYLHSLVDKKNEK